MPPRLSITAGPLLLTTRSEAGIGESGDSLPTNPGSVIYLGDHGVAVGVALFFRVVLFFGVVLAPLMSRNSSSFSFNDPIFSLCFALGKCVSAFVRFCPLLSWQVLGQTTRPLLSPLGGGTH